MEAFIYDAIRTARGKGNRKGAIIHASSSVREFQMLRRRSFKFSR